MRFYEFEAKALLGRAGVPVAKGGTATSAEEAARIAASVGGEMVLKSQVLSGGRIREWARNKVSPPGLAFWAEPVCGRADLTNGGPAPDLVQALAVRPDRHWRG